MTMKRSMLILAASALIATMSCQKEKETQVEPSPDYDPTTNTVKTNFVLSVSTSTGKDTKTSPEFTQVSGNFLGMQDVHLLSYELPFTSADHGAFFFKPINAGEVVKATRDFNLGNLMAANSITEQKASRSIELSLPLGTNNVVLYGKALKTHSEEDQGSITITGESSDLTTLKFSLNPRLKSQGAFDAGAFVFSRIINYLLAAGIVNENTFWNHPVGTLDRSYAFWFPLPSAEVEASLPASHTDGTIAVGSDGVTYTYYMGELSWKQLGRMYDYEFDNIGSTKPEDVASTATGANKFGVSALGQVLGEAYSSLTTIKASADGKYKELRAGSAPSILHTLHDLHTIIEKAANAVPNIWEEQVVKLLAQQLDERMHQFFIVDTSGELDFIRKDDGTVDVNTIKTRLQASCSPVEWSTYADRVNTNLNVEYFYDVPRGNYGFPTNIGLPYGAAIMVCDRKTDIKSIDAFDYTTDIPAYGFGDAYFPIANYRYAAELLYYGNSPIRVSDELKKASDYPPSISTWNTDTWWNGWQNRASVQSTTRSVAMENNINYGTALLASKIKFADGITALKDNNAALHPGEEDQTIPLDQAQFLVTGLIIGGQPDVVGWDFTRYPDYGSYAGMTYDEAAGKFNGAHFDNNGFDKMIYDRVLTPIQIGSSNNTAYTFVWDNYDATKTADEQADVYVGLEILNRGEDFWGEMNLVRKNGVFYLLGKLDLSDALEAARQSSSEAFTNLDRNYYCYPPFNPSNGKTINVPRVFMQDYMTTADLVIGADALKHAYVTVPDLRSGQVSLGVSIDMTWTPGLAFTVPMGEVD